MSSLDNVTRCPRCQTSFRVTDVQLNAAGGAVRCGSCLEVFQASAHLLDPERGAEMGDMVAVVSNAVTAQDEEAVVAPNDAHTLSPGSADADGTPLALLSDLQDDENFAGDAENPAEEEAVVAAADIVTGVKVVDSLDDMLDSDEYWSEAEAMHAGPGLSDHDRSYDRSDDAADVAAARLEDIGQSLFETATDAEPDTPDQSELQSLAFESLDPAEIFGDPEAPRALRQWPWALGALLLLLVLGAQYTWSVKDRLAQNVTIRPYYQQFCRYVGCQLKAYQNSAVLTTTELVVRSHPTLANALKVDAIIKNAGAFGQLFPNLTLSFVDANGAHVAQRTFKPADYLAGELVGLRYFPAYTEVRFSLAIVDPGKAALSYHLTIEPTS